MAATALGGSDGDYSTMSDLHPEGFGPSRPRRLASPPRRIGDVVAASPALKPSRHLPCAMRIPCQLTRLSGGLLLLAVVGCSGTPSLDPGTSRSEFPADQGIASEGNSKRAQPQPVIETFPQEESRPNGASTRQQVPHVATRVEQSGEPGQQVGNADLRMAYLSEGALEMSKVNSDAWLSGTVLIEFTISPSGQVLTREVKKSSGSKSLDDAALAALDRAAPFPPMPPGVADGPLKLQVPVEFVTR